MRASSPRHSMFASSVSIPMTSTSNAPQHLPLSTDRLTAAYDSSPQAQSSHYVSASSGTYAQPMSNLQPNSYSSHDTVFQEALNASMSMMQGWTGADFAAVVPVCPVPTGATLEAVRNTRLPGFSGSAACPAPVDPTGRPRAYTGEPSLTSQSRSGESVPKSLAVSHTPTDQASSPASPDYLAASQSWRPART